MSQTVNGSARPRIAIVTTGRFHMVDLAREFAGRGASVIVYTLLPARRLARFGLEPNQVRCCWPALALGGINRWLPKLARTVNSHRWMNAAVENWAASSLEPCDAVIGMSGMCGRALQTAKARYGATTFVERSSQHILTQQQTLQQAGVQAGGVPAWAVKKELAEYSLASQITVPSEHVRQSFLDRGVAEEKLFLNPLGVDLEVFRPTPSPAAGTPRVLFVGTWCRQKGCDILTEALIQLPQAELHHVGAIGDLPFPSAPRFVHHAAVPQHQLPSYYAEAQVAVLPSRQDGFGMVMSQALACGLPVVCSDKTGGSDLERLLACGEQHVRVVPVGDVLALSSALSAAISQTPDAGSQRGLDPALREELGWGRTAERYLQRITEQREASGATRSHTRSPAAQQRGTQALRQPSQRLAASSPGAATAVPESR